MGKSQWVMRGKARTNTRVHVRVIVPGVWRPPRHAHSGLAGVRTSGSAREWMFIARVGWLACVRRLALLPSSCKLTSPFSVFHQKVFCCEYMWERCRAGGRATECFVCVAAIDVGEYEYGLALLAAFSSVLQASCLKEWYNLFFHSLFFFFELLPSLYYILDFLRDLFRDTQGIGILIAEISLCIFRPRQTFGPKDVKAHQRWKRGLSVIKPAYSPSIEEEKLKEH